MEEYIGLDVSMKETAVSIRRDGKRIWRGKCGNPINGMAQPTSRQGRGVIAGARRVALKINHSFGGWLFPDRMEIRAHDWTAADMGTASFVKRGGNG